jgi:hypothetical protein
MLFCNSLAIAGNESDYVIVSVVRTDRPGFLQSLQRMNVMLSRCKKGMVVVTNGDFLKGSGGKTLLGKMSRHWSSIAGRNIWVSWRDVMNGCVDLPGVSAPKPPAQVAQITESLPRLAIGTAVSSKSAMRKGQSANATPKPSGIMDNQHSGRQGDRVLYPVPSANASTVRREITANDCGTSKSHNIVGR